MLKAFNTLFLFVLLLVFAVSCGGGGDGRGETYSSSCYGAESDIYKGNTHRTESVRYPQAVETVSFIDNGSVIYTLFVDTDDYITLPDIRSAFCLHGRAGQILTGWDNASITYRPGAVYKVTGSVTFTSDWDNGTEIYTADNLSGIRDNLTGTYKLMRDIDLRDFQPGSSSHPTGWIPIGDGSNTTAFSGKLYGNGYKVDNLSIDNITGSVAGLFGALTDGAAIYDLGIDLSSSGIKLYGADVNKAAGALAGKIIFGASTSTVLVENVHTLNAHGGGIYIGNDDCATFLVTDRLSAGGLIGEVVSTADPVPDLTIARSSNALNIFTDNSINVACESHLGGIIGAVNPDGSGYAVNLSIQESKNIGSVSAHRLNNDAHIGGALGYAGSGFGSNEAVLLKSVENQGPIEVINSSSSGYASSFYAGGLMGQTYNIPASILDCVNEGIVNITTDNIYQLSAGGLAGYLYEPVIKRSCNKGNIIASITWTDLFSSFTYAGGLSGVAQYSPASDNIMENCNEGNITAIAEDAESLSDNRAVYAGGLFGYYYGNDFDILNNSNSGAVLSKASTESMSIYTVADVKAGGIIGAAASSFGSLTNNLNSGTVKADASGFDTGTYDTYSGGISGYLNSTIVVDKNVSITSSAEVTVTPSYSTGYRGLIAGGAIATTALGTYTNYSLSPAVNEAYNITDADGEGKMPAELHTQSTYEGISWDFTSSNALWAWDGVNNIPILKWTE